MTTHHGFAGERTSKNSRPRQVRATWWDLRALGLGLLALCGGCMPTAGGDGASPPPPGEENSELAVTPTSEFRASGLQGGPFAPASQVYTVTNNGSGEVSWTASVDQGWLTLSSTSGTLGAGTSVGLTVSVDQGVAAGLGLGSHSATVTLTDTDTGITFERDALLTVNPLGGGATASSLSQFGIRWQFASTHPVGQYANGDWWVVGPVTITEITPKSVSGARHMNGSMINPSPKNGQAQGYDSTMYAQYRVNGDYNLELNVALDVSAAKPLIVQPHESLVSTISHSAPDVRPQVETTAILTVVPAPPAPGSFRPPYCGKDKTSYFNESQLRYELLQSLPKVGTNEYLPLAQVERMFERPWLDHVPLWIGRYIHPSDSMPDYGREISDHVGIGAIYLHLDFTDQQKRDLLVRYVQLGIDFWGIVQDGGKDNWPPSAGHMSGRKWPILFAGLMLNDPDMSNVGFDKTIQFGEDGQCFYVEETSPGVYNWGYGGFTAAHVGMPEWGTSHSYKPSYDDVNWNGDPYRQCCTANAWWGQLLAARVMGAQSLWDHDSLFDYQDRYLTEMRSRNTTGWQLFWRDFYEDLWDTYRPLY